MFVCAFGYYYSNRTLDDKLYNNRVMSGASTHEIIDPILIYSPYADDLREGLDG